MDPRMRGNGRASAAMPSPVVHDVTLVCHPGSRAGPVRGIGIHVRREAHRLVLKYSIAGNLAQVCVPPPRLPRIADGLWRKTCCECFIALAGQPGYHEFNFSPSGEWAAYAFVKYRDGEALMDENLSPGITVQHSADALELDASISLGRLSARHARETIRLALSAVIEDQAGRLSYWALKHPASKPDFHHPDSFILNLKAVSEQV